MRNRKEVQKSRGGGWEHLRAITAAVGWVSLVAAAAARYLLVRLAGEEWRVIGMGAAAGMTASVLYWALLRGRQRA